MPGRCTWSGSSSPGSTSSSTSATVTRPAIAASGLKLRADLLKTRFPCRSPLHARTRPKSATTAGAQPLGQGALRGQLDLELTGEVLARELLVLADVGRDHAPDPFVAQQDPETPVVDAAVVRDRLEVADARVVDRTDEHTGDAAEPETTDRQRHPVGDALDGRGRAGDHLVHG